MSRRYLLSLAIPLVFGLYSGTAFAADHERGHEWKHQRHERIEHREARREHERREWREEAREHRMREEARERRARWERERWRREHDRRPPGWEHGRKTGWGGRDLPPGLAKKEAREHERWREHRTRVGENASKHPVQVARGTQPSTQPAPHGSRVWPTKVDAKQTK